MGLVVEEKCSNCNEAVYMPVHCHLMRCPHCKEVDIINSRREKEKKISIKKNEELMKKPHLLASYKIRTANCPKCGTEFSCSPALSKGKIFCPKCGNPMAVPSGEEE